MTPPSNTFVRGRPCRVSRADPAGGDQPIYYHLGGDRGAGGFTPSVRACRPGPGSWPSSLLPSGSWPTRTRHAGHHPEGTAKPDAIASPHTSSNRCSPHPARRCDHHRPPPLLHYSFLLSPPTFREISTGMMKWDFPPSFTHTRRAANTSGMPVLAPRPVPLVPRSPPRVFSAVPLRRFFPPFGTRIPHVGVGG